MDLRMAIARKNLDWGAQFECTIKVARDALEKRRGNLNDGEAVPAARVRDMNGMCGVTSLDALMIIQ